MNTQNAIIVDNDGKLEARCRNCGKLLFVFETQNERVDILTRYVKIVSRCARSGCKTDNIAVIKA